MYFIINGKAVVLTATKEVIAILNKSDYFGEMGIVTGKSSTRTVL